MDYENDEDVLVTYNELHSKLSNALKNKDTEKIEFYKKLLYRFYMKVGVARVERVTGKDKRNKGGRKPKQKSAEPTQRSEE